MKINKTLLYLLMVLPALLLQSCLKDQEDVFDTPSSIRMQEVLDNAKRVLTSSEQGWVFDYYPDRNQSYGGYVYTVKFDSKEVTAGFELAPGVTETSLYKLTNDNGPVLTFDSYNTLLHFFATPSSSAYEGMDGDFEFVIMSVTDDLITLRGKRTGNTMYMRRLTKDPVEYINAVSAISDNIITATGTGTVGNMEISCNIDLDGRRIDITYMNGDNAILASSRYIPSETGIRFYTPLEFNGATLSELNYDTETFTFSGKDSAGNDVTIIGTLAEDYAKFDEFAGTYLFKYYYGTIEVTLVPDKDNNRYLIKGLNENYDVVANYVKSKGYLNVTSQKVGESDGLQIWLCGWALDAGGNLTTASNCGMYLVKDLKKDGTFNFVTNDYLDVPADSFILYTASETALIGAATAPWLINNKYQVPYLEYLVKK